MKYRKYICVFLLLCIGVLAACSSLNPAKNGVNFACFKKSTMDICSSESSSTAMITYSCSDEANRFTKVFEAPNDPILLDIIRTDYAMTYATTGVVLDENDNLIQLYQIDGFGLRENWPNK